MEIIRENQYTNEERLSLWIKFNLKVKIRLVIRKITFTFVAGFCHQVKRHPNPFSSEQSPPVYNAKVLVTKGFVFVHV